tara:strand:- start:1591 stop:1758 length:168 start_codon:yes stop_codon:yes gene_type:complete
MSAAGGDEERTTMSKEVPAILSDGRSLEAANATKLAVAAHTWVEWLWRRSAASAG